MKLKLYIFLIAIIFTGCQSIKFDKYPGKALDEFPSDIQGKYKYIPSGNTDKDTVIIFISKNSYSILGESQTSINFLDSSNVFSEYKQNKFMFVKDGEYWSGFNIKKGKKGLIIIPFLSPKGNNISKNSKFLSKYFSNVTWVPSTNKLESGTFSASMNEDNLLKYIRKNKRYSMNLIQVKE